MLDFFAQWHLLLVLAIVLVLLGLRRVLSFIGHDEATRSRRIAARRARINLEAKSVPIPRRMADVLPEGAESLDRDPLFAMGSITTSPLSVYEGRLVEKIPRIMTVGKSEQVEVRLGQELKPQMILGLVGTGALRVHDLPTVDTMCVSLYAPDSSFTIEPLSPADQLINPEALKGTLLATNSQPFGRWVWNVTPLRKGQRNLNICVSARVLDSHGHPTNHTLPDRIIRISVKVNHAAFARKVGFWAVVTVPATILVAVVGAAIQDDVWPALKQHLLQLLDR